jgi:hypothetical protein
MLALAPRQCRTDDLLSPREIRRMNGPPTDAQTKALEFVNSASTYLLIATMALLAWQATEVELTTPGFRFASM